MAQATSPSIEDIARQRENPLSEVASFSVQNTLGFPTGPYRQASHGADLQPVIPFHLGPDWNLVTRTTIPTQVQPRLSPEQGRSFSIGDVSQIFAITPSHAGPLIWGAGLALSHPTASTPSFGSGKWSTGPALVVLTMPGDWVIGALAHNVWSFAGAGDRDRVSLLTLEPFIYYNFPNGSYITSNPTITANWIANGRERWTVPIGGGIGRLFAVRGQAIDAQAGVYYNVMRPAFASNWQFRFDVSFFFPK
ncbi:hypothetical protein LQG66_02690 [Bradyrhizobium ontarionense]|uniref:Neuromedin U n=1 Tax=Bradyrhizobium ontarionense TaxID=2898149 RepID=A0ABY3RF06_9BRAD|nr:hypothetical protein [Bradyrhizobium sp. A19]UFZ05249.1 hypothetical protein LQG66_02690 [Bradyrhizobium sp. A19]